jgi:hypothetical protein
VFDRGAKLAFIVACVTLIACGIGFRSAISALNAYLKKEPVELRRQFVSIPTVLPRWQGVGTDEKLDEAFLDELGTDQYLTRRYQRTDGEDVTINVHLTYYTGLIDAVPHVPDRCLVAAGLSVAVMPVNYDLPIDRSGWSLDPQRRNVASGSPYPIVTSDLRRLLLHRQRAHGGDAGVGQEAGVRPDRQVRLLHEGRVQHVRRSGPRRRPVPGPGRRSARGPASGADAVPA